MKGEPVNLSNMEKKIREEFENVKESFKDKNASQKIKSFANSLVNLVKQIVLAVLSILKSIFGFSFLLIGIILLSLIASFFIFDSTTISIINDQWISFPVHDVLNHFANEKQVNTFLLSLFGIIIIPIVSLTYAGIRLLLGYKGKSRAYGIISFILLLFSAIILSLSIIDIAKEFRTRKTKSYTIESGLTKQLFLKVRDNSIKINSDDISFTDHNNKVIITKDAFYLKAENEIHESKDSLFHIKIKRSSNGQNKQEANENLEKLDYKIELKNDTLYLDYYSVTRKKFRGQEIEIQIFKPKNGLIKTNIEEFMDDDDFEICLEDQIF
jgi:hypothetical protein